MAIEGVLVESQGSKQKVELKATKLTLVSDLVSCYVESHHVLSCLNENGK